MEFDMGGSGSAGAVEFPAYIEDSHRIMLYNGVGALPVGNELTVSLFDVMETALGTNPFTGSNYTDPATDLTAMQTRYTTYDTLVAALDPETDFDTIVEAARTHALSGATLRQTYVDSFRALTADGAEDLVNDYQSSFSSGLDENTDYGKLVDNIVSKIDESSTLTEVDAATAVDDAIVDATAVITAALAAATTAVGSVPLDDLVTAYTARIAVTKTASLRNFHAGMADINAVHSTAFIWGGALIEREAVSQIAGYRAEVEGRIYQAAMIGYGQSFGSALSGLIGGETGNARARDGVLVESINATVRLLVNRTSYEKEFAQLFVGAFQIELAARLSASSSNAQLYTSAVSSSAKDLQQMWQWRINEERDSTAVQSEIKRIKIVGVKEFEEADFDLDEKFAKWDFDVMHMGSNVLAAPSGMAAMVPSKGSRVGSAIGGALQAAGLGGKLGTIAGGIAGGPAGAAVGSQIGTGIGAILGGLGGLFG